MLSTLKNPARVSRGGLPVCHAGGFRIARFDAGVESDFILVTDGDLRFECGARFGDQRGESGKETRADFRCGFRCYCFGNRHTTRYSIGNAKREL